MFERQYIENFKTVIDRDKTVLGLINGFFGVFLNNFACITQKIYIKI